MKSRLLPPPIVDERESLDSPAKTPARRSSDSQKPKVEAVKQAEPTAEPKPIPAPVPTRSAPQVSARPQGRLVVAAILVACVSLLASLLYSTFFRDAAFGVVTGKVTEISPPWSGTLTAVYVQPSERVRQGEVLAVIEDPELQDAIDELTDDLREVQAQLDAKVALLAVEARNRNNKTEEIRADYYDLRGELLSEQSRLEELTSKLTRRQELAKQRAISSEEIQSLRIQKQGLNAKIENLQQAVAALEARLTEDYSETLEAAQLKPQLARIENYQAEIRRLRSKQHRGTIRAPFDGTVVATSHHVGERITTEQSFIELLPSDAIELVLYVPQGEAESYQMGQLLEIVVEPVAESLECKVARVGQRLEKPERHVAGRYRPEEKLLPIYLTPPAELPAETVLRIGSTVRLPATLFGN